MNKEMSLTSENQNGPYTIKGVEVYNLDANKVETLEDVKILLSEMGLTLRSDAVNFEKLKPYFI